MVDMSNSDFSRPGAVDLSSLAAAPAGNGSSYVVSATEADVQALAEQSTRYPVLLEFYSASDAGGQVFAETLAQRVNARTGKMLLARVEIASAQQLAQSLGVQAVPTVVALIGAQLAPLFQGTADAEQIDQVLDQVAQLALANGITGTAPAQTAAPAAGDEAPAADPRLAAAEAAITAGDYQAAVAEYDKLLAEAPHDQEVAAGRAQAALLARVTLLAPAEVAAKAAATPADLASQLAAADVEIAQGQPAQAFDRLLNFGAKASAEDLDSIRVRLLELFLVVGNTAPEVLKARRRMASLLF